MRVAVDGEPGDADGAARHALGADVERAMGQRDGVGARPPVGADRERHDIVAGDEIDVDEALDHVADERDRRLAGEGRGDAELRLLARRVVRLVERHDDIVGRVGARRSRPADVEGDARLLAVERLDVEPMRAPADAAREFGRRVGADVDRSARDALRRLHRLVAPAAVGVEPLVVVGHLIERPFRALPRDARAVRRDGDRLERRDVAGAQRRVEVFLHADRHALRPDRQGDGALDRAPARLGDVDDQLGLERARARAFGQVDRKVGVALGVGLNLVGELAFDGGEIVVGEAADIAGIAGQRRALDRLRAEWRPSRRARSPARHRGTSRRAKARTGSPGSMIGFIGFRVKSSRSGI